MKQFSNRKYLIGGIILVTASVLLIRLLELQVLESSYKYSADSNTRRTITIYPARGLIFDRNRDLLVCNVAAYDLMMNPSQLSGFDTTDFCGILNITKEAVREKIKKARDYSRFRASIFLKQISSETYAVLQEKLYKFPGFFVQPRTLRKYPPNIAAHVLGYVGEVDEGIISRDQYYKMGDYIGISGIEQAYEIILRGKKGVRVYLVDVHNRIKGSYQDGRLDKPVRVGRDIVCTLDAGLQKYGEKLMDRFAGSIAAIEPSSGEVLALVSSPDYQPELLVGRARSPNYTKLVKDTLNPLFNRAVMAQYPPGSTFKVVNGLIALHEGRVRTTTEYYCDLGFHYKGYTVGCHYHDSPLDFVGAIQNSCNAYFSHVFLNIINDPEFGSPAEAFNNWRKHILSFGLGQKLETDFTNELSGLIPTQETYDNIYGKGHWNFLTIRSLAIGQGELGITPLQMANLSATIANRGHYFIPHVVKSIQGETSIDPYFSEVIRTTIDTAYYEPVVEGMYQAVNGGRGSTAWRAKVRNIAICGKTGTAENPHGEDHSIFIAFAPREDPQIAVSVYVENGGFGNTWAAPIASLMIEKYLTDSISRPYMEDYVLHSEFDPE